MTLEFCIASYEEALAAAKYGAQRVELCAALELGGLTPSAGLLAACCQIDGIEVHAMIRPRAGGFVYSDAELGIMQEDIRAAAHLGADGVVFGVLTPEGTVDMDRNAALIHFANGHGLDSTFHRAFDRCADPLQAVEDLVGLGFKRILSSGQAPKAIDGVDVLHACAGKAGGRIELMAGSGVNAANAATLIAAGVDALHCSIRKPIEAADTFGMASAYAVDTAKIETLLAAIG